MDGWSWIGCGEGREISDREGVGSGGGGLTVPSMHEENFLSAHLSISYSPHPIILLPEHSRPIMHAATPNTIITTITPITGPTDSSLEWLLSVIINGGGCCSNGIDIMNER